MSEYAKDFYYIHKKERSFLSLYNLFSYLPYFLFFKLRSAVTSQIANLVEDSKVTLVSDQLNLPKISENSVPLYASLSGFATTLRTVNKLTLALPAMVAFTAVMPWLALSAVGLHYFIYFKVHYFFTVELIRPCHWQIRHQNVTLAIDIRTHLSENQQNRLYQHFKS